ncbi:MAG: hypothetical protein HZA79_09390 [Sphingobacteriales bacterium]|nr:hypothetical protein [Sphingobacteriales bacterium]
MKKLFLLLPLAFCISLTRAQSYKETKPVKSPDQILNELYCSGLFKSEEGRIFDIRAVPGIAVYTNILNWLLGQVAGLQVCTSRNGVRIPLLRGQVPGIYVDEIPVTASYLEMLNSSDIGIIKVIRTPFFGGFNGGNGAIAIYTLRGDEDEERP